MSKKNNRESRELTVEDRFDLMFGNNETEDETSEDWFHNKRDFAEQIAKSFGVSDPDDVEEPTSILKPSNIDDFEEETESNDTAEDVINMLGIKSGNEKDASKSKEKSDVKLTDSRNEKIVIRETSGIERAETVDKPEPPAVELWLNERTHVLHYSDRVRRFDMPLEVMRGDYIDGEGDVPSLEDFRNLYEKLVLSSLPVAAISELEFNMQYLYGYTFYKDMPFRFLHVGSTNDGVVFAYILEPDYRSNVLKTYTSLKEIGRVCSACRLLSFLVDPDINFTRIIFREASLNATLDNDSINHLQKELSIYGRNESMLIDALKDDPFASNEPSEDEMKDMANLKGSIFIYKNWRDMFNEFTKEKSNIPEIFSPEVAHRCDDDDKTSADSDESEEEDLPTLAPKDEEERRSIMEAFGQSSDDDSDDIDDDEEDSDDSDEEEEEDISKFLKDDDDKDDGDDIIIDVKR